MKLAPIYKPLSLGAHSVSLLTGAATYRKSATTPDSAYQSLIWLYCHTQGVSNDIIHSLLKLGRRPYDLPKPTGVLGQLSYHDLRMAVDTVKEQGYYRFPAMLS